MDRQAPRSVPPFGSNGSDADAGSNSGSPPKPAGCPTRNPRPMPTLGRLPRYGCNAPGCCLWKQRSAEHQVPAPKNFHIRPLAVVQPTSGQPAAFAMSLRISCTGGNKPYLFVFRFQRPVCPMYQAVSNEVFRYLFMASSSPSESCVRSFASGSAKTVPWHASQAGFPQTNST